MPCITTRPDGDLTQKQSRACLATQGHIRVLAILKARFWVKKRGPKHTQIGKWIQNILEAEKQRNPVCPFFSLSHLIIPFPWLKSNPILLRSNPFQFQPSPRILIFFLRILGFQHGIQTHPQGTQGFAEGSSYLMQRRWNPNFLLPLFFLCFCYDS